VGRGELEPRTSAVTGPWALRLKISANSTSMIAPAGVMCIRTTPQLSFHRVRPTWNRHGCAGRRGDRAWGVL